MPNDDTDEPGIEHDNQHLDIVVSKMILHIFLWFDARSYNTTYCYVLAIFIGQYVGYFDEDQRASLSNNGVFLCLK